jgi:hypothetical protein
LPLLEQGRGLRQLVLRSPEKLHIHPALARLNFVHLAVDLSQSSRFKGCPFSESIEITTSGIIIGGFTVWHDAASKGQAIVECIEHVLTDEQALEFIIRHHQPRRTWNNFVRVVLALELEPHFQKKALANQIAGGKYKGLANLPRAEHVDVREEIATIAGVSGRTVSNVKMILEKAAPGIIEALQHGTLTINRALPLCSLPRWKQMEHLDACQMERANKVIRHAISKSEMQRGRAGAVLEALIQQEARDPGSVLLRVGTRQQTVVLLGQDLLSAPLSAMEVL